MTDFGMYVSADACRQSDLIKVVKGIASLKGDESDIQLSASLAGHLALRENGLLMSSIECGTDGKPSHIVSYWKLSEFDTESLPRGQRYAYLPRATFEALTLDPAPQNKPSELP